MQPQFKKSLLDQWIIRFIQSQSFIKEYKPHIYKFKMKNKPTPYLPT